MMLTSRKPNSSTKNQYVTSLKSTAFADLTNCSLLSRAFKHNFGGNLDETTFTRMGLMFKNEIKQQQSLNVFGI